MPNIQSAKKRLRQNIVQRERNRAVTRAVRTQCRKVLEAVESGNVEQAEAEFRLAAKKRIGPRRNVIHRNAAARTKSRLSKKIKLLKKPAAPTAAG